MAVKTTLNAKNLEVLGAERLAALVMEVADGDATRKRIARAALLEAAGGTALAGAVSKRLISLRRAKNRITYRKRRAFIEDLDRQRELIAGGVATHAPKDAFDLMWRFMALADAVHRRVDDSGGTMGDVFRQACRDLCILAAKAGSKPEILADQVFQAVTEGNRSGAFDGVIAGMAPALGPDGLARLRILLRGAQTRGATSAVHRGLLALADATGDVDAYIAEQSERQRRDPIIAAGIADRLVAAGRAAEALEVLDGAEPSGRVGRGEWTTARLSALDAMGRIEEAQSLRWSAFERDPDPAMLRAYLKGLPDFEDDEAEDRALGMVASGRDIHAALAFLIAWPDHRRAAALVKERHGDLDGDLYYRLGPAADALEVTEPLAATLLLRAMIEHTLDRGKSPRYAHAARHLRTCGFLSGVIEAWDGVEPHDAFETRLRKHHGRRARFWHHLSRDT